MWWWSGVGAVIWILMSVALALLVGRAVRYADLQGPIDLPSYADVVPLAPTALTRGRLLDTAQR